LNLILFKIKILQVRKCFFLSFIIFIAEQKSGMSQSCCVFFTQLFSGHDLGENVESGIKHHEPEHRVKININVKINHQKSQT